MVGDPLESIDLDTAADRLYAVAPEHFVALRTELAAAARAGGDRALATALEALRKPTAAAAVVNRQVLTDPSVTERLREIGDWLRAAQSSADGIDRDVLRELSVHRRTLVHDMAARAIESFAPAAGATIRDEVSATFDAAVADPSVAEGLGRLLRAQRWSGFGTLADAAPLTVVQGGRSDTSSNPATGTTRRGSSSPSTRAGARAGPAVTARHERELSAAEARLISAEQDLSAALDDERAAHARAADLEKRLTDLQAELGDAEHGTRTARAAVRSARSRHREARSARDRAARRAAP